MGDNTKETGMIIIWMDMGSTLGKMEECTKVNTETIKNTVTESTNGPTVASTQVTGTKANNTESVRIKSQRSKTE